MFSYHAINSRSAGTTYCRDLAKLDRPISFDAVSYQHHAEAKQMRNASISERQFIML